MNSMKKMALIPWGKGYLGDALFDSSSPLNRDDGYKVWDRIKNCLISYDWEIHTIDVYKSLNDVDLFVFFSFIDEWYDIIYNKHLEDRTVYVAFEPPVVDVYHSKKGIYGLLKYFKYILTWNDDLVDGVRIFKFMTQHLVEGHVNDITYDQKKLLVNISGNKNSGEANELYSERKRVIEFFDETGVFELYGPGWEREGYNSYKGVAESKAEVYSHFKFALCLENMKNIKGYITEKILDCFCSGIVPIYLGASNIDDYIPPDCYIHYDAFETLEQLKAYLMEMTEEEYRKYQNAIDCYLKSEKIEIFKPEAFVKVLMDIYNKRESFVFRATGNSKKRKMQNIGVRIKYKIRRWLKTNRS